MPTPLAETIAVRAPVRLDFGGGWTDVPPYPERDGGFVCSAAIGLYATATVSPADDSTSGTPPVIVPTGAEEPLVSAAVARSGLRGIQVTLHSDFPVGAGLGGSSAAGVALVTALAHAAGQPLSRDDAAELSRTIEVEDLGISGGRQDHYAAAHGGFLALGFGSSVEVRRLAVPTSVAAEFAERCVLVYTGQSRISGATINAVLEGYRTGNATVTYALRRMRDIARAMAASLEEGDVDGVGALIGEQWAHQRALHPGITTALIDRIVEAGRDAGAIGGKALGASGGGCVLLVAGRQAADRVRDAVRPLGTLLPVAFDMDGVKRCA